MKKIILLIVSIIVMAIAITSILFYFRTVIPHGIKLTPTINELSKRCNNSENAFVAIYHSIEPNIQLFNMLSSSLSNAIASNSSNTVNITFSLCVISYRDLSSELRNNLGKYSTFPIFGIYSTKTDLSTVKLVNTYFDDVESFFVSKPDVTVATYAYIYSYNVPILNNVDIYLETLKKPILNIDKTPVIGSIDAKYYIFIYEDAWCPYCAKFYIEVLPGLEEYIKNNTIALVLKNLIVHSEVNDIHRYLVSMYMESKNSTYISIMFKEIYGRVYNNVYPTTADVLQIMKEVYGSIPDVDKYNVDDVIAEDAEEAQYSYGIFATPGFVVWDREKGVGVVLIGYRSIDSILNIINFLRII